MSWVAPWFLLGLGALAIPVVVHLLRSRQFERADLGTLRFLHDTIRETARWRRLRDLLLLLLRLLVLALLVALFARPFLAANSSIVQADAEVVLLLDSSASMGGRRLGANASSIVRERANAFLKTLPDDARVTLAEFGDGVRELRKLPSGAMPTGGATDYERALRWAADRLTSSTATRREIILATDMQRVGLPPAPDLEWPTWLPVRILEAPQAGAFNVAVISVKCLTPYADKDVKVQVIVEASGSCPMSDIEISLTLDGAEPIRQSVPLIKGAVIFTLPRPEGHVLQGIVRIDASDAWPNDDSRPFAYAVRRPVKVVLVNGEEGESAVEQETYFLETALRTAPGQHSRSPYNVQIRSRPGPLEDVSLLALCNVRSLDDNETRQVREFVAKGGALVYFLGDRVEEWHYRRLREAELFPAVLKGRQLHLPRRIITWEKRSSLLGVCVGQQGESDLSRIVFRDAFELEPDEGVKVLASLEGDVPAIFHKQYGEGQILVVSNPCDREWTDWPTETVFVPLVRELVGGLAKTLHARQVVVTQTRSIHERRAPGIYAGDPLEVVVEASRESRVENCSEADFRKALGIGSPPTDTAEIAADQRPAGRRRPNELWLWLALALLALLMVEHSVADGKSA
ncbi:MAG: BatA and WFA domain-containing protein [Lentisphaeria bacterium]|nr:BatA and WFA domain-containing protein [Lentisphaeria bacterium]